MERYAGIESADTASVRMGPGSGASGRVYYMRSARDAERLKQAVNEGWIESAVVAGISTVSILITDLLQESGIHVVLTDRTEHVSPSAALDDEVRGLERRLMEQGVALSFGSDIRRTEETENGILTYLANGKVLESDILVLCAGAQADMEQAFSDLFRTEEGGKSI